MSTFVYDVFLSHSATDKPRVRRLAERLRSDGVRVWFDDWEIGLGDSIQSKINEGLERTRLLILAMSRRAVESDWAKMESYSFLFRDPLNHERRFVPLLLEDMEIPLSRQQILIGDLMALATKAGYLFRYVGAARLGGDAEIVFRDPYGKR